jgi:antitoxin MazE
MHAKLISIGNSKGVRLPKRLIEKYHLHDTLELEEKNEGILIKTDMPEDKLTFEATFREMAEEEEMYGE